MELERLEKNSSWDTFSEQWKTQCAEYEEEFENYASASLGTLGYECDNFMDDPWTGVFGLKDGTGTYHAACFLNSANIKGFSGRVLRVRHLVLSPYYDFEDLSIETYAEVLAHCFREIVRLSNDQLESPHIKIHYRSPYDRQFFAAFGLVMKSHGTFGTVESKGMWLHLTKA